MTAAPTRSPFYMLMNGNWIHLEGATPGVPVEVSRPSSSTTSLGGVVRTQRAPKSSRSWALGFMFEDAATMRWLNHAASGMAGDVWLLDRAAAQVNMLDPRDCIGQDATLPLIDVEGSQLYALPHLYKFTVKCRAGVTYWFGGTTTFAAAATIAAYQINDEASVPVVASPGTGARAFSTSFTPDVDADVLIQMSLVSSAGSTALRLTEGAVDDVGFIPGQKAPCQVSVSDPQYTMNFAYDDALALSDYTVTLTEVGQ